ncbi:MAG TPA: potassium transporter TrkG, partial [Cryomorphaceae bacterium]|nr:potassium transporter TrkG [Cryomorphaceae bacterium]
MALCIPSALYYEDGTLDDWFASIAINAVLGVALHLATNKNAKKRKIKKRDGYIIVTFSWIVLGLSGTVPFILTGAIPNFSNAFFESISGFTTTGASVLDNIESMPESILFWRSITQWIGGLGFIVLVISILPSLGIGGMQLFLAEAPGITADKLKPRIQDTAKRLWFLYIGLTLALTGILYFLDMGFFDAINHALTTLSTGGFSTKQGSVAHFNSPAIEYVISFFMFLGGTSFVLLYLGFKGKIKRLWNNEEFRAYLGITLLTVTLITVILMVNNDQPLEQAFRKSLFQVIAVLTTTGYSTADHTA